SMILKWSPCLALAAGVAWTAAPAQADVMEIDADGARWIAGGQASAAAEGDAIELSADYAVPSEAVAMPARHASIVPDLYAAKVQELARRFDLSPALIEALVWQESRWRANAVSPVGARGLA